VELRLQASISKQKIITRENIFSFSCALYKLENILLCLEAPFNTSHFSSVSRFQEKEKRGEMITKNDNIK
jgi:hypothetical protein